MKTNSSLRLLIASLLLILITNYAISQKPITIKDVTIKFKHGEYPGFSMHIPEVSYEAVAKDLEKRLEKGTKSDITIEDGEYSIFGAQMDAIYENPINIYTILSAKDSGVLVEMTFELKPKEFISQAQSQKEYALAKEVLTNFGKDQYLSLAQDQFKEEEKVLRVFERELQSLRNDKVKMEKSIIDMNNKITNNDDDIEVQKQLAQSLNDQLGKEKSILIQLESETSKASKEEEIRNLEKEKDRALKQVSNLSKDNVKLNSEIDNTKLEIETNLRDQSAKQAEIDIQKQKADQANQKILTIEGY